MNDVMDTILKQWKSKPKSKPRMKDVRDMTIRELCSLADEVRSSPAGSKKMRRAADRMAVAAWHLENGALQQMLWWTTGIEPEAPPDGKATVVEMPKRHLQVCPETDKSTTKGESL